MLRSRTIVNQGRKAVIIEVIPTVRVVPNPRQRVRDLLLVHIQVKKQILRAKFALGMTV
jgi:hypothetical protein